MNRLVFALLAGVVLCALSLVQAQHRARTVFIALERAQTETAKLNQDAERLQYELSAYGKSARIAEVAEKRLKMQPIRPNRTDYIALPFDKDTSDNSAGGSP